jgi:dihydrofolate reductase/thymidylate synthase
LRHYAVVHDKGGVKVQFLTYFGMDAGGKFRASGAATLPAGCAAAGVKHEELQYLDLIRDIIDTGNVKGDRTGGDWGGHSTLFD